VVQRAEKSRAQQRGVKDECLEGYNCWKFRWVILRKEILERLRVGIGDGLHVVETKNGIELTAYDPAFAEQVETAERGMREDRDALKKLAE